MRKYLLIIFTVALCASSFAQEKRGYEKSIELKGAVGLDERSDFAFGVAMINGYRFNPYLFVGVGVGYEFLKGLYYKSYQYNGAYLSSSKYDSKEGQNILQLYGRIKANFTKAKFSPFASLDIGNSFNFSSTETIKMAKGFFIEPAVGFDFGINDKQTLYVALGYNNQQYEYEFINTTLGSSGHEMIKTPSGTFTIHVGLCF